MLKSTSVVSFMTLLSRILGLVRDVVFARMFGATIVMDAFIVANRIPNMFAPIFRRGSILPGIRTRHGAIPENHDHPEAREFVDAVAGTLGLILFVITLIGVIAAPLLVLVVAPGFVGDDGRFELSTAMLRFTFPYLFFVSLTAFAGGVLNTYGKFGAPAFTPVILNVVLITGALWLAPRLAETRHGTRLCRIRCRRRPAFVSAAVPGESACRAATEMAAGARRRSSRKDTDDAGDIRIVGGPGNVLLGGIIASLLGVGKISLLYYSDRLMEFPLGVFGIALAHGYAALLVEAGSQPLDARILRYR